ncbi:hypothetical protein P43SY_006308 [Pythium insidiosum]|uniref:Uncharacterized protein n=1 Tax=Pythium insidiosum TaxID=114742 RepID=A0AAD5LMF5_PYTIN|nr:hypothetical protein P43SY_006308 [Pythium insidiosum]
MKTAHDQKVRSLMRSINQLQEQIQQLKTQDKEHRRSALIQSLRQSQREQELLIDILKQTLVEKVPEFQESRELVNDFILKKSIGAPLRFRPKTREELENELDVLDGKYKRAVETLQKAKDDAAQLENELDVLDGKYKRAVETLQKAKDDAARAPTSARGERSMVGESKRDDDEDPLPIVNRQQAPQQPATPLAIVDPSLQEEIDRLKVELASKTMTIHTQADELHELMAELDKLRIVEERLERKQHKISALEEKISHLQQEAVALLHEKEAETEKNVELHEQLQFLRSTRADDGAAADTERLQLLEKLQQSQARESEVQRELEEQQKKWALDRSNIHQQTRLLEKEKQLLEEEHQKTSDALDGLQKRHDRLFAESERVKEELSRVTTENDSLRGRIQESMSREEREAHAKSMAEQLDELQRSVAEKDELAKKLDRQLNAAKLLGRQAKKEKEQALERCTKLQEELAAIRQQQQHQQ